MAAPNVSVSYWRELTQKYAEYAASKNHPDKKLASLLSNKLEPAMKISMEAGDYEDAKIIWLTRANQVYTDVSRYNTTPGSSLFTPDEKTVDTINDKLKVLNMINDEKPNDVQGLRKITDIVANQYLTQGFPIMAATTFISVKDIFNSIKTLVRTRENECGYLAMGVLKDKSYEGDIMMAMALKAYRTGCAIGSDIYGSGLKQFRKVVEKIGSIDVKVTVIGIMKNLVDWRNNNEMVSVIYLFKYLFIYLFFNPI